MNKRAGLIALIAFFSWNTNGQTTKKDFTKNKKGFFYFAAGSHRNFFTPSTIRVIRSSDPSFDFTLLKVKGRDEGGLDFSEAPQFSYTVGYYFKYKKFGIEYQYDHTKYFVRQNQVVRLKGNIGGKQYVQDTVLNPDFFQLEHSDGANYAMVNFVKWIPLLSSTNKKIIPEFMIKGGIGLVNPKTNSTILGKRRDDRYHISGYIVAIESGLRLHIGKHLFATGSFKGAFANYSHFLIWNGYGKQKWFSGQLLYLIGGQFPL